MPVSLQKFISPAKTNFSPKFFHQSLTGSGGKVGLLNQQLSLNFSTPVCNSVSGIHEGISVYKMKNSTLTILPTLPFPKKIIRDVNNFPVDLASKNCYQFAVSKDFKFFISVYAEGLIIEESFEEVTGHKNVSVYPKYFISVIKQYDSSKEYLKTSSLFDCSMMNTILFEESEDPKDVLEKFSQMPSLIPGLQVDMAVVDKIKNTTLYELLCLQSEIWQSQMDQVFEYFYTLFSLHSTINQCEHKLQKMVFYLENYNLSLDQYRKIYSILSRSPSILQNVCDFNLSLGLYNMIDSLDQNKSSLIVPPSLPANLKPENLYNRNFYSDQQRAVIETNEPLILCQSGAGTGKSTVVKARISYLTQLGVYPDDILVLSFTNAAANHIHQLNDRVKSMTIAGMIHELYSVNFPAHTLSDVSSLRNALKIYFTSLDPLHKLTNTMYDLLKKVENNVPGSLSELNILVKRNLNETIQILSRLNMTTLELEIILCCALLGQLKEPASIAHCFLIVDEVQDTNIFEFIFLMKWVQLHQENLMIIGDCSQTLYEFRFSDPKVLNILESSGVFATYQLSINYRSNQAILEMANMVLQNIIANQYAQIQLSSNSLATVSRQNFEETVKTTYLQCTSSSFSEYFPNAFCIQVLPYIRSCLQKQEKVAILAYSRREIRMVENILEQFMPDVPVSNLCPTRVRSETIFSDFVLTNWQTLMNTPCRISFHSLLYSLLYQYVDGQKYSNKFGDRIKAKKLRYVQDWYAQEQPYLIMIESQKNQNLITQQDFLEAVKKRLLSYENVLNAKKRNSTSIMNEQRKKDQNAPIVLSTIHSAKGMEFDHTVILCDNSFQEKEDRKRMIYVALTRAMKSEFIFSYGSDEHSLIQLIHKSIANGLIL